MEWFESWFGEDYLLVYGHRDAAEAEKAVDAIIERTALRPGMLVLDLCCGAGRHAAVLARRGFRVAALDYSRELLADAAHAEGTPYPLYVRGDARALPFAPATFACILNLFTSFGYFDDEGNARFLADAARLLAPGGIMLIDYLNPPCVIDRLVDRSEREHAGMTIVERRECDMAARRVNKTITLERDGETREFRESVRLYERDEMFALMAAAGLVDLTVTGSLAGAPYGTAADRMVLTGRRREG